MMGMDGFGGELRFNLNTADYNQPARVKSKGCLGERAGFSGIAAVELAV
jgi:hypothetical protein